MTVIKKPNPIQIGLSKGFSKGLSKVQGWEREYKKGLCWCQRNDISKEGINTFEKY